jgi:hypothetical protein
MRCRDNEEKTRPKSHVDRPNDRLPSLLNGLQPSALRHRRHCHRITTTILFAITLMGSDEG